MKRLHFRSTLASAQWSGKLWFLIAAIMALSNVLLAWHTSMNDVREKTVFVPPDISQPFWVQGNDSSPEYLTQVGTWFASLVLSYTPKNLDYRIQTFLRYASPESYGALRTQLNDESERIKEHEISAMFFPMDAKVRGHFVAVMGQQIIRVGKEIVQEKQIAYRMKFQLQGGFVHITEFKEVNHVQPFIASNDTDTSR